MNYTIKDENSILYITRLSDQREISVANAEKDWLERQLASSTPAQQEALLDELFTRRKYVAVIEALPENPRGELAWMDPDQRGHHLYTGRTWVAIAEEIQEHLAEPPDWFDEAISQATTPNDIDIILRKLYPEATIEYGEYKGRINPEWLPSMGRYSAWGTDDWQGAADYISFCTWCDIIGYTYDGYDLPENMNPEVREYLFPS